MDYLRKNKKWEGHRTNYLSGGPNLTIPPHISRIILYTTLMSVIFRHLYNSILLVGGDSAL